MASESTPPAPPTSGGARYAIVGVALAALAALGWCLMGPGNPPPTTPVAVVDAGHVDRSTALVEDSLDIPEPEPDAGPPPDVGPPEVEPPHHSSSGGSRPPAGEWDRCVGAITPATALAEVRSHDRQIRTCYERRLRDNPLLTGNMNLSLMINADGSVGGVRPTGSLRDREFITCVRAEAMRMHFPHVTGGPCTIVNVPYTFTPEN